MRASIIFGRLAGCSGKHLTLPGQSALPKAGQREMLSQTHARKPIPAPPQNGHGEPGLQAEVAVVGAGPAGLTAALALAAVRRGGGDCGAGLRSRPRRSRPTHDGAAAGQPGVAAKSGCLGAVAQTWRSPFDGVRIVDDRGGLLRAPEVLFRAAELGLQELRRQYPQSPAGRRACGPSQAGRPWSPGSRPRRSPGPSPGPNRCASSSPRAAALTAKLVVAADGRASVVRAGAGIATRTWRYPQAAIATSFCHTRPHAGDHHRVASARGAAHRRCRCRAIARAWSGSRRRPRPPGSPRLDERCLRGGSRGAPAAACSAR